MKNKKKSNEIVETTTNKLKEVLIIENKPEVNLSFDLIKNLSESEEIYENLLSKNKFLESELKVTKSNLQSITDKEVLFRKTNLISIAQLTTEKLELRNKYIELFDSIPSLIKKIYGIKSKI